MARIALMLYQRLKLPTLIGGQFFAKVFVRERKLELHRTLTRTARPAALNSRGYPRVITQPSFARSWKDDRSTPSCLSRCVEIAIVPRPKSGRDRVWS